MKYNDSQQNHVQHYDIYDNDVKETTDIHSAEM